MSNALVIALLLLAAGGMEAAVPAKPADPAPAPAAPNPETAPVVRRGKFAITAADRAWWAFQPVRRPPIPAVQTKQSVANPLDAFLLTKLESKNLGFNPRAARRELIRRAYFDLIGLPPSPEAVAGFVHDPSPNAWETLIDRLLALPQYGERWGRHWLDLVRYAESNGYERDGVKPYAWRYRDYVVRSFNQDKPYNRFLIEQLAGDELPGGFDADAIVATGFYRLHVWDDEPDSSLAAEFDDLDDIMVTTSATFLGLTVGCARCHDHKFDPISQVDYYQMLAFIRGLNPYGLHHTGGGGRGTGKITRALATADVVATWQAGQRARVKPLRDRLPTATNAETKKQIESEIQRIESEQPPYDTALAVHEDPIKPTQVFHRGDVQAPGPEVEPAFLSILGGSSPAPIVPADSAGSSGRRLTLARWLARPEHPLTARVLVNRLWQHHFGRALVKTPNDFGRTGEKPTHPELLDYLAAEVVAGGWHLKRMHKLIMMSEAYQMSSRATRPNALAADEANELFWRQNPRRAEAEVVRDTLLTVSGALNSKMAGPSVFPTLSQEVHSTQDSAGKGWTDSPPAEQNRRTIYLFVKRALIPPLLDSFDYNTVTVPVGARSVTTVAPQALMLLNDRFVQLQGERLAERLRREVGDNETHQLQRAFALVLQRPPTEAELAASRDLLTRQRQLRSEQGKVAAAAGALQTLGVALLNLNELLYID